MKKTINKLAQQLHSNEITSQDYKEKIQTIIRSSTPNSIPDIETEVINSLYTLNFGYPSLQVISNTTGIPINKVKSILLDHSSYTRFVKPIRIQNYRFTTANYIDEIWTADLSEWGANNRMFKKQFVQSDGYVYILHIIDVFSRYAWLFPLQDKEGKSIADCFHYLAKEYNLHPNKLFVDKGSEFYNKYMNYYCKKYDVEMYSVTTNRKASIAERNIRSIREIIFKYFEENDTQRWIDILDRVEDVYNNRVHRLLQMSPSDARLEENREHVYNVMNSRSDDWKKIMNDNNHSIKFNVGDKVRTRVMKGQFDKGTRPTFSKEIYTIKKINYDGVWFYVLAEIPNRFFYEEELIKITR